MQKGRHVAQICSLMHMQLQFYKNTYTSTRLNTKQPHAITRVCGEISVKSFTSTEIAHTKQYLHSIYTTTHEAFLVFVRAISIWTNPSNCRHSHDAIKLLIETPVNTTLHCQLSSRHMRSDMFDHLSDGKSTSQQTCL